MITLVLDDASDGSPFNAAPLLTLVVCRNENYHKVGIAEINLLEENIEIWSGQLRSEVLVVKDSACMREEPPRTILPDCK